MKSCLALDLSLARTGFAVLSARGLYSGSASFIQVAKGEDRGIRYVRFHQWLKDVLELHAPERVVYEEPHLQGRNPIYALVPLVALVQYECALRSIAYSCVHTQTLKRLATGSGKADKQAMKRRAKELFPDYDIENDRGGDVADALCLLHVTLNQ